MVPLLARIRVGILGSGSGTNAHALCVKAEHDTCAYSVEAIISTSAKAGICNVARRSGVELVILPEGLSREALVEEIIRAIDEFQVEVLALAGFMRLLPDKVIHRLEGRVLNIHPALLPDFGGKGMFGLHVHRSVLAAGVLETGATVHIVTDQYDEGAILGQKRLPVFPSVDPEDLQRRIKVAENELYPGVMEQFARSIHSKLPLSTQASF